MGKDKLNILLINRWVGYNEGGNEAHMQGLIKWFTQLGHKVTVITTKGDILEKGYVTQFSSDKCDQTENVWDWLFAQQLDKR